MTLKLRLPANGWEPREHQKNLWGYLEGGGKRAIAVWHRRAGKDEVCLHYAMRALWMRPGNYWHLLPEFEQARRAIWTAVNPHTGRRRIDEAFPHELRENTNDSTMFIRFKNGSTWACLGSDRYDATMGASPAGMTFSEYALSNPSAWGYLRPMLEENDGWAVFITTPRGRNHAFDMFNFARRQADWFAEALTARDTGALSTEELDKALDEYVSLYGRDAGQAMFDQEMMVSVQRRRARRLLRAGDGRRAQRGPRARDRAGYNAASAPRLGSWRARRHRVIVVSGARRPAADPRRDGRQSGRRRALPRRDLQAPRAARLDPWRRLRAARRQGQGVGHWPHPCRDHASPGPVTHAGAAGRPRGWHQRRATNAAAMRVSYPLRAWPRRARAVPARVGRREEVRSSLNPLHDWTSHSADAFRYLAQGWQASAETGYQGSRSRPASRSHRRPRRLAEGLGYDQGARRPHAHLRRALLKLPGQRQSLGSGAARQGRRAPAPHRCRRPSTTPEPLGEPMEALPAVTPHPHPSRRADLGRLAERYGSAACPSCGSIDARPSPHGRRLLLTCPACAHQWEYGHARPDTLGMAACR